MCCSLYQSLLFDFVTLDGQIAEVGLMEFQLKQRIPLRTAICKRLCFVNPTPWTTKVINLLSKFLFFTHILRRQTARAIAHKKLEA